MIIETSDFRSLPGLVSAVLNESVDSPATLELTWSDFCPDWVGWETPVTVLHRGRVLFHGKITSFSNSNTANEKTGTATATNAIWLLDHLTLGAQIAEWQASQTGSSSGAAEGKKKGDIVRAAASATQSWSSLAASCRVQAPGWAVDDEGHPRQDAIISLDTTDAVYSAGVPGTHKGAITAWTALLEMRQANPDAVFVLDYTTGTIRVVSVGRAEHVVWDTGEVDMADISGIAPQYEDTITGVLLLVSWDTGKDSGSLTAKYPPDLPETADRVRMFTATAPDRNKAVNQLGYMSDQLRRYYEASNILQWGGSITALIPTVPESPLGRRLSLTGPGTHDDWHDMAAIVSGVTWDFAAGTVQLTLGRAFDEPTLAELEFADDDAAQTTDDGYDDGGDDGGDDNTTYDDDIPDTTREDTTEEGGTMLPDMESSTTEDTAESTSESASSSTGDGSYGSSDGSGTGHKGGDISLQQQIFNAIVHLRLWGNGADVTMPRHYVPDIFPEWWTTKMDDGELLDYIIKLTGCNQNIDDHHGFGNE